MCRAVTCRKCHKPTWAGCGAHVEQVLGHVPKPARCSCREVSAAKPATKDATSLVDKLRRIFGG